MNTRPLPEITRNTIGPGHLDIVHERLDMAIGIADALFAAIANRAEMPERTESACHGQTRLLEEACEHLSAYQVERAEAGRHEAARQPINSNALAAAVERLNKLSNVMANHAPNNEDFDLLLEALALLEGRLPGGKEAREAPLQHPLLPIRDSLGNVDQHLWCLIQSGADEEDLKGSLRAVRENLNDIFKRIDQVITAR
jgi:hypothetical protein